MTRRIFTQEEDRLILEFHEEISKKELMERLGISYFILTHRMQELGIQVKKRCENLTPKKLKIKKNRKPGRPKKEVLAKANSDQTVKAVSEMPVDFKGSLSSFRSAMEKRLGINSQINNISLDEKIHITRMYLNALEFQNFIEQCCSQKGSNKLTNCKTEAHASSPVPPPSQYVAHPHPPLFKSNETYEMKLEYALSLGYDNVSDAIAKMGKFNFENGFKQAKK